MEKMGVFKKNLDSIKYIGLKWTQIVDNIII